MNAKALSICGWTAACMVVTNAAHAARVDFNFSISYSGQTISGRLVGLNVDASGNAIESDPLQVLIYHAPAIVGLPATPQTPYVFLPQTFERSTLFNGTFMTTTPGVYGFQVTNFAIVPDAQNLLMIDASGDVTLVFNFGAGLCYQCGVATYGIMAEEDALWPAINCGVSFTAVGPTPPVCVADSNGDNLVNVTDLLAVITNWGACPPSPTPCFADVAPSPTDHQVNVSDLLEVINQWGTCPPAPAN